MNSQAYPLRDGSLMILLLLKKQMEFIRVNPKDPSNPMLVKKFSSDESNVYANELLDFNFAMRRGFKCHNIGVILVKKQTSGMQSTSEQLKLIRLTYDGEISEELVKLGNWLDNIQIKLVSLTPVAGKYFQAVLFNSTPALIKVKFSPLADCR